MKIAVLSRVAHPLHGIGGLERHVGALVRHLVRAGEEVTLYTAPADEKRARLAGAHLEVVPYRLLPWPRRRGFVVADRNTNYLVWSLRVGRKVAASTVDIVQAEAAGGFGYAWLRTPGAAPLVLHPHGMEEFKSGLVKKTAYLPLRLAVRYAARRAERVLVPDGAMEKEVEGYLSVDPKRMVVLPNAVDLEEIDRPVPPETRRAVLGRLGIEDPHLVILSVGRLEPNKGFSVLAGALGRIREELPHPWLWIVVGQGPEASRLKRKVGEAGLEASSRFAGRVSDAELSVLYRRADLFVHPTLYEGSSQVTLEAMAHGRPVVASAVGGIPDKVEEGKSGFLVPPAEPGPLAAALVKALSRGTDLAAMGRRGRQRVESRFTWRGRVRKLLELYGELLAERRG